MTRDSSSHAAAQRTSGLRVSPCPGNHPNHVWLELPDEEARRAGLPPEQPVHVDRSRTPTTGDLVWVELVRHGSTQRLVRRYALDGGWVSLSSPGGGSAAVMRRRAEILVLGVVDRSARCATHSVST